MTPWEALQAKAPLHWVLVEMIKTNEGTGSCSSPEVLLVPHSILKLKSELTPLYPIVLVGGVCNRQIQAAALSAH